MEGQTVQFDLKFDKKPFGGILSPSVGSDQRFDIFNIVTAERADYAAAASFLG